MFRLSLLLLSGLLVGTSGRAQSLVAGETRLLEDITLRRGGSGLVFGNARLRVELDTTQGRWRALRLTDRPDNLLTPDRLPTLDAQLDGEPLLGDAQPTNAVQWLGYQTRLAAGHQSASLEMHLRVTRPGNLSEQCQLTLIYTLFPNQARLDRAVRVVRTAGSAAPQRLEGFWFRVPGVALGPPADCVVDVPGPFFPNTYVRPQTPYPQLTDRTIQFHSAPDAGFGVLAVGNPGRGQTLASWMDTGGEVNYTPSLVGNGRTITMQHHNHRAYWLPLGTVAESDGQRLEVVNGTLTDALASYRQMVSLTMPPDLRTPAWVNDMVLLEVYPKYFPGGVKAFTQKLPFYQKVGFNTVYLMPHWQGGYGPMDLYAVDKSVGTADDLRAMVRAAHGLGMRVLFDMVIHGFDPKSPVVQQHPDWFVRGPDGKPLPHPTWKSASTDWASPAYQRSMADLVLHDLHTYDIDGYRVDAASYKGAGWDPSVPYPAYRSGTAAPELMRVMLDSLRRHKPDAVLLSEVFGPVFYGVCNLAHDNQTEAVEVLLEKMARREATAADYQAHLANVYAALPAGANRVCFTRNHDTSWFYHFNGYTPRLMAMEAIHALFAIPEVFAGDPDHGPSPDQRPDVYETYRKLFALRRKHPELSRGTVQLEATTTNNPMVFTGLRQLGTGTVVGVVSLSDQPATLALAFAPATPLPAQITFEDPLSGQQLTVAVRNRTVALPMKPFQTWVGRLR